MRALIDGRPALPWSDWAMTPAGLTTVCVEIASRARREVVELGSGVSTILIARLLSERGGQHRWARCWRASASKGWRR
jgi:hypothetical protein